MVWFFSRKWTDSKEKNSDKFETFNSAQAFITSSSTQDSNKPQRSSKNHHYSDTTNTYAIGKAAANYQYTSCTYQRYLNGIWCSVCLIGGHWGVGHMTCFNSRCNFWAHAGCVCQECPWLWGGYREMVNTWFLS